MVVDIKIKLSKRSITSLIILAVALGNAGSTLYLPALISIGSSLSASSALMKLSLSLYLISFGLSQIIYGPLSDAFGRRINLLVGLSIFVIGSLFSAYSEHIFFFLAGRFLQGIGIGASNAVGYAYARDVYNEKELPRELSYFSIFVGLTPIIAPLFGGYLTEYFGWRSCFFALATIGIFLIFAKIFFLPETNLHCDKQAYHPYVITKKFQLLVKSPTFLGYVFITALAFSILMVINTILPFIVISSLALSPSLYGWIALCVGSGYFTGAFFGGRLSQQFKKITLLSIAASIQFLSLLLGLFLSLFYFNLWVVVIPLALTLFGIGFIIPIGSSGALEPFPKMAGSGAALLGFSMFLASSLFSALGSKLSDITQFSLFLFLSILSFIAFLPLILLKKY